MLDKLRCEDFLSLVGTTIAVESGGSRAELEVKEAQIIQSPTTRAQPPFRITLRSRSGWRASQGMFRLVHPTLGPLDLFAVPLGPDAEGLCYEIILN